MTKHGRQTWFAGWMAAAFLLITFSAYIATRPRPVDVLGLPQQKVNARIHGVPGTRLGSPLSVTGTKCLSGGNTVRITGKLYWQAVQPPGTQILAGGGSQDRPPGCKTTTFANLIPAGVDRATRLLAGSRGYVVWRLTGIERPTGPNGVERAWVTQPFRLYVR